MIRVALEHTKGHIGHDVCIDGTQADTPAALRHCCRPGTCPNRRHGMDRAPSDAIVNERHLLAEMPEENLDIADVVPEDVDLDGRYPRWKINGHWYELRDRTAGIRWYADRMLFWAGFYIITITDQYTGAVLCYHVTSASTQESKSYEPALERLHEIIEKFPRSVTADKGFSTKAIFSYNTERNIYSVIPTRADVKTGDDALYDITGAPRCRDCDTRTEFVRHSRRDRGQPRNMYRCPNGCGDHQRPDGAIAAREIAVTCDTDPRLQIPLPRTHPLYQDLDAGRSIWENSHHEA